jgi:hypothetical protein
MLKKTKKKIFLFIILPRLRHGPGPPGRAGPGPVFSSVRAYNIYDRPESPGGCQEPAKIEKIR